MEREFEVEIDGAVFKVKQIIPEEAYGKEEAELVARACLLADEKEEKQKYAAKTGEHSKTVFSLENTEKEIFREKITEKYIERQTQEMGESADIASVLPENHRRQIEELSRYLSRDSRRYEGNFDMY